MNGSSLTHERNLVVVALMRTCFEANAPSCICEVRHMLTIAVDQAMCEVERRGSVQFRDAVTLPRIGYHFSHDQV